MRSKLTEKKIEKYRKFLIEEEKSQATVEKYLRDIRLFGRYISWGYISKENMIAFKKYLMEGYQAVSVNSMLSAINSFLGYLGLEKYRVKKVRIQREMFCRQEKELSREEYQRLIAAAGKKQERLLLMMQTMCATGIRVSELQFITVTALQQGYVQVHCKHKLRTIWLPARLTSALKVYAAKMGIREGMVFQTRTGKMVGCSNIWQEMKRLCKEAKVVSEKVFPHNLRHLFARCYYEKDRDIVRLADILGHCSTETTRIYTITSGKEQVQKINRLNLVI